MKEREGRLIIFSAPSGSGKSTIIDKLTSEYGLEGHFSVSATSRSPRGEEVDGVHYYFLSPEEFRRKIEEGEFLEHEEVYPDHFYGTLRSEVDDRLARGEVVLLDIDVVGALNVKKIYGAQALTIFIQPPGLETLRERLEQRGTDAPEKIEQRLSKASYEMTFAEQFDSRVTNDNLDFACWSTRQIIEDFLNGVEKHIVLFPGSFSPMHVGHLALGNYLVETHAEVTEIWYSLTPESPFKQGKRQLPETFRIKWAEHLLQHHPRMQLSLEELSLPRPNYTVETLHHYKERYPRYRFSLLMGSDSWMDFPTWYKPEEILADTHVYIYPRPGYDVEEVASQDRASLIHGAPRFEVSSSEIRQLLSLGADLPYLLMTSPDHPLYKELIAELREE
ncbi:MAG: guanylate kinase [Porphyromonas sp.]|nr:guanylate kinase [Porphyromonas sp.]